MKAWKIAVISLFLMAVLATPALAVDLTNRISMGYNHQLSYGIVGGDDAISSAFLANQSFSCKYWATREIGIEGILGFMSAEYEDVGGWGMTLGGKFHYNVIMEQQMNVYTGGGLALLPVTTDDGEDKDSNVGFLVMAFAGTEFFLPGLPNLAFDMELGLQYLDYDEYRQFGTYSGGFGMLGIRYYF
ncbi:MAG TPA: hypothetical protein PKW95_17880 [bacterium]|nr:hypothetical protein [bacterium]